MRRVVGSGRAKEWREGQAFGERNGTVIVDVGHLVRNRGPDAFFGMGTGGLSPRAEDRLSFLGGSMMGSDGGVGRNRQRLEYLVGEV